MSNKKILQEIKKNLNKAKAPAKKADIDYVSKMGYRDDSPFNKRKSITINTPDGSIDMSNTGKPLLANGKYLPPYSGVHQFNTNKVTEEPLEQAKKGGSRKYSKSLLAKNRLFEKNKLFKKKNYKNKIYDPSAMYFEDGGEFGCPDGYTFNPITGECVEWTPTIWSSQDQPTSFDPIADIIYMNPNDRPEGMSDEEYNQMYQDQLEHEQLHRLQWINDGLKGESKTPLRMPSTVDNQDYPGDHYYNRRQEEENYLHNYWKNQHPHEAEFIPDEVIYDKETNPAMYELPWTEEGEARDYENATRSGMESFFPKRKKGGALGCPPGQYWNGKNCVKIPKGAKVITNPKEYEKRKAAYDDSTNLHKLSLIDKAKYLNAVKKNKLDLKHLVTWNPNGWIDTDRHPRIGAISYSQLENSGSGFTRNSKGISQDFITYPLANGKQKDIYLNTADGKILSKRYGIYKKPKQPVVFSPKPKEVDKAVRPTTRTVYINCPPGSVPNGETTDVTTPDPDSPGNYLRTITTFCDPVKEEKVIVPIKEEKLVPTVESVTNTAEVPMSSQDYTQELEGTDWEWDKNWHSFTTPRLNKHFPNGPLFNGKKKHNFSTPSLHRRKDYEKGGALLTKKVTCKKCGWTWDAADGGNDMTTCHKCGGQGLIHAQNGGDTDGMTGMMKARLAYANEFGNPAAKRMINLPDNPYQFENGDTGTHYMASYDNYAVPQIQDENGVLQLGDYGQESNEAIRFDSDEDANYFAENYKDVSPGFIEADLDEDEIEDYRKGGYIVEDISVPSLTRMDDGGEKRKKRNRWKNVTNENPNPEATRTPIDPRYIEQNPDTAPYYLNQPEVALTPRGKNWITSTPKYAGLYINPETGKLEQDKSKLATGSAEMVYPEKYFIGPGGGLVGGGIKGLERISAASIPGLARIPGATVGNALGAGFAADALVNRLPEGVTQLNNGEYIDAAGNIITGLFDVAGANMISPIYQGAKSIAPELGNLAMKTAVKTLQLPGLKPFLRSNYNPISYPIKLLGEKIARQSLNANRNKKEVIAALTKKAAPEENLYFGNTNLVQPDLEYGYGKRDLIANYFRGIDTGFKPIDYDIYSDPGLKKYIDRYGPLKTYELNSSVKHGQPLDIANFNMKLIINDSKLNDFDHDLYDDEFFQMPGLEDYYYNEYMRNLPGTSTPSPYEAQRQYYKKMLHQYFDERGIEVLPIDVAPNYNANVKNYLDFNPVISFDDIAGHMGYLKRLPNKKDFEFTTRDIWKFTPDDYHSKWAGASNKAELFKQLQVEAMDAFGKPIVLTQTNPIKFKNGGSIELELTPKQIKEYIKAGYILEEISIPSLTRMQPGGETPETTYTPIDPNYLAANPDTYSQIVNKPEVLTGREGSDIGKLRAEFREKNPMDIFLDEKKRQYLKKNKGLNKAAGVTMENFPEVVLQNFIDEYEYKTNNYAVNKLGKKEGWNPKRRGEWVDELTPGERDAVAESKYGSKLQPSYWSRSLAGLATLASPYSPEIQKAMNEGNMPGLTKNESKEILNSKVLGIPIGGLETLAPIDIPGAAIANLVKNTGLSTGSDYKEQANALAGEKMANVSDMEAMAVNPLTYAGLEALPELGVNLVKGVGRGVAMAPEAISNLGKFIGTEEGLLSNAYKLNPKALKEAQETMLVRARPVGQNPYMNMAEQIRAKEAAGEPLKWYQKNLLNPQTNPNILAREKYYGQWFADNPSDLDFYINPGTNNFPDNAQIEILKARMPKSEAAGYSVKNFEDAKKLSNLHDIEYILPKDMVQQIERYSVDDLPKLIEEYNQINKPHWLKGYKEVPAELPGSPNTFDNVSNVTRTELNASNPVTQLPYDLEKNRNAAAIIEDLKYDRYLKINSPEGKRRIEELITNNPHMKNMTYEDVKKGFANMANENAIQAAKEDEFVILNQKIKNLESSPNPDLAEIEKLKIQANNLEGEIVFGELEMEEKTLNAYMRRDRPVAVNDLNTIKDNFKFNKDALPTDIWSVLGSPELTVDDLSRIIPHEFGHYFQQGAKTNLDDMLSKISLKTNDSSLNSNLFSDEKGVSNFFNRIMREGDPFQRMKKYWRTGSKGREKTAFMEEVRADMLQRGMIEDLYQTITPELLKDHYLKYMAEVGNKYPLRIYEMMKNNAGNFKIMSNVLNKMPALVPIGAVGAGMMMQNNEENNIPKQKRGGIVSDLSEKKIKELIKQGYIIEEID
jgi:hypothetical protein